VHNKERARRNNTKQERKALEAHGSSHHVRHEMVPKFHKTSRDGARMIKGHQNVQSHCM
jgi:hypothetical protein